MAPRDWGSKKLRALDLRLLRGLAPEWQEEFCDEHSVEFMAKDGLPAQLQGLKPMHPFKEAVVVAILGFMFIVPPLVMSMPIVLYCFPVFGSALAGVMLISVLWPSRYWPTCQTGFLASWILEYFSVVFVYPAGFNAEDYHDKSGLLYTIPHAVMPVGSLLCHLVIERIFGFKAHGYAASILFKMPFVRHFPIWMGSIPAEKKIIRKVLQKPREGSGGFLDGIAGMFEAREDAEVFYIGKRTGAFRLALEHGSIMLAGFCCGAQEVMSAWYDGYGVLKGVSRTLRMSLLWPYGRWFLPIPRRVALILVYAPPVECEQADAPTEEQVFDLRDRFLDAVQESFDVGKQIYPGWEKRRLIIKTD